MRRFGLGFVTIPAQHWELDAPSKMAQGRSRVVVCVISGVRGQETPDATERCTFGVWQAAALVMVGAQWV